MIFISYRISDSLDIVGRLDADLTQEFGVGAVFRDKTRLQGGQDWTKELERHARGRMVMLVVIGPTWQTAVFLDGDRQGFPRLSDPEDWVRREITLALESGNLVIPVLLNGRSMPPVGWLRTCGLEGLAARQAVSLRSNDYEHDLSRLTAALRTMCPQLPPRAVTTSVKRWLPAVICPLQPAPHFCGRQELLADLTTWAAAPVDKARVIALVAPGGTGKTALAERVVAAHAGHTAAGMFVWSFYSNPQTEAFLNAACEYITGDAPKETGGLLARLQQGLLGDTPHLFVLDGLELIQADGSTGRPRGEFENEPQMKMFLRWLAAGHGTRAVALITSRFPLPNLADWRDRGYREELLNDLDTQAARAVLRKRGVRGDDMALAALAESVHGHALTLDVLGLYLARFWGGDPTKAPTFDPSVLGRDAKAYRLSQVLTSYAEKLPAVERDLLARLSLFPRGVTVDYFEFVGASKDKDVAGALARCGRIPLLGVLQELCDLGLVFRVAGSDGTTYSAHPFLRDFFRNLLGAARPEQIHEAVRVRMAASLDERPGTLPTAAAELDRYERLIEITRLAGQKGYALRLYQSALGGYEQLAEVLGENARGLRILASFSPDATLGSAPGFFPKRDWALFAMNLGDLVPAELVLPGDDRAGDSFAWRVELRVLAGAWKAASEMVSVHSGVGKMDTASSHCLMSLLCQIVGNRREADVWLSSGQVQYDSHDVSFLGSFPQRVLEADLRLAKHERSFVRSVMSAEASNYRHRRWTRCEAICATILGRCALPEDTVAGRRELNAARAYAVRSGNMEVTLRCFHLAAELARHEGNFALAITEARDGIQVADSCGFGRWLIDIRIELAKAYVGAGVPSEAIEPAEWVLRRSREEDCRYAWGAADALHLLGVANARLGEQQKAYEYLQRACEERRDLEHPGLGETEAEFRRLGS